MIELVIFDCDGVLIDSEVIIARVQAEAMARCGHPVTIDELLTRFLGTPDREMYAILERERGRPFPEGFDRETTAAIEQAYSTDLAAIDGIHEAIAALGDRPKCVASSSVPSKIRHGLAKAGLSEAFDDGHIFSATMVARGKPAPDIFLYAAEKMNAVPARCLVIEDSVAGVQAAKAAGMRVIGFTGGGHIRPGHGERLLSEGAMMVFGDMRELPKLLEAV